LDPGRTLPLETAMVVLDSERFLFSSFSILLSIPVVLDLELRGFFVFTLSVCFSFVLFLFFAFLVSHGVSGLACSVALPGCSVCSSSGTVCIACNVTDSWYLNTTSRECTRSCGEGFYADSSVGSCEGE
jgi:hypothetical protein